jgi:hypothetical protein
VSTQQRTDPWHLSRPYLIRHFLLPGLAGVLAGLACVAALLGLDVGGLGTLMLESDQIWVATPLLCIGFATTFGSAAIGASVMAIGDE